MAKNTVKTTATANAPVAVNPPIAANPLAAFSPSETDISLMREIDNATKAGNVRYISQAEGGHLVANGFVAVNVGNLDAVGNAAANLTEAGNKAIMTDTNSQVGAPAVIEATKPAEISFFIANVEPPVAKRGGGAGREAKYPLDQLAIGQAIFVPLNAGQDAKAASKSFGSLVSGKNRDNAEVYFTSRAVPDGFEAGFRPTSNPEMYKGVAGTGIYRQPLDKKPARKPRTPKAAPAPAAAAPVIDPATGQPVQPQTQGTAPAAA